MKQPKKALLILIVMPLFAFADNLYTDNVLQPTQLANHSSGWSVELKAGHDEGSGEIIGDGWRYELPRITGQINAANTLLFRATVPQVWIQQNGSVKSSIGDPSFFTTVRVTDHQSFTIGVTEPAANRAFEPDVVRFLAFYTGGITLKQTRLTGQLGVEIPDRFGVEGQDDTLSFGLSAQWLPKQLTATIVVKQVVDGQWWDITQPLESPLNRRNATLTWRVANPFNDQQSFRLLAGVQRADTLQTLLGLKLEL